MKAPLVVWALQAPTLLNLLARSDQWRLEVSDLGDASGLDECRLLTAPAHQGGEPAAVVVCTPAQLDRARRTFPRARIVWALHNGRRQLLPPSQNVHETLCFSHHVAALQRRDGVKSHVIVPAYAARQQFRWSPDKLFVMTNRPNTRTGERERLLDLVEEASGKQATRYGQGQRAGFLRDRSAVYADCSGYLSALPDWAGFGLAEHECFAAGVPVVGNRRWGDMEEELPSYGALALTVGEQGACARRVAEDPEFAAELSADGLAFIERCRTAARMDEGIERLLGTPP